MVLVFEECGVNSKSDPAYSLTVKPVKKSKTSKLGKDKIYREKYQKWNALYSWVVGVIKRVNNGGELFFFFVTMWHSGVKERWKKGKRLLCFLFVYPSLYLVNLFVSVSLLHHSFSFMETIHDNRKTTLGEFLLFIHLFLIPQLSTNSIFYNFRLVLKYITHVSSYVIGTLELKLARSGSSHYKWLLSQNICEATHSLCFTL